MKRRVLTGGNFCEREKRRDESARVVLGHRVGNQLASKQVKALGFLYPWAAAAGGGNGEATGLLLLLFS